MADPVEQAITENIKRAADDNGHFETYDLDHLVEAERYVKNNAISGNPFAACKKARAIQPGPVQ